MIARAETRYVRISPRKFRQIVPLVKGRRVEEAIAVLMSVKKKASLYAIELIKSAVANAGRIQGTDTANLYITRLIANCGPTLKRFRAASMGRASSIRKRTSHLIVELDGLAAKEGVKVKEKRAAEDKAKSKEAALPKKALRTKAPKQRAASAKK